MPAPPITVSVAGTSSPLHHIDRRCGGSTARWEAAVDAGRCLVAYEGSKPVGYLVWSGAAGEGTQVLEIVALRVVPDRWERKVGDRLVTTLRDRVGPYVELLIVHIDKRDLERRHRWRRHGWWVEPCRRTPPGMLRLADVADRRRTPR